MGVKKIISETHNTVFGSGNLGKPSEQGIGLMMIEEFSNCHIHYGIPELNKAMEEVYNFPLKQSAIDKLNRHLKSGVDDILLAELVTVLSQSNMLCNVTEDYEKDDPQIICSMGLKI